MIQEFKKNCLSFNQFVLLVIGLSIQSFDDDSLELRCERFLTNFDLN